MNKKADMIVLHEHAPFDIPEYMYPDGKVPDKCEVYVYQMGYANGTVKMVQVFTMKLDGVIHLAQPIRYQLMP
jgi:hypothetical protein